jgi:RNA polymerase sigma-70 factor (ECF subfamily)
MTDLVAGSALEAPLAGSEDRHTPGASLAARQPEGRRLRYCVVPLDLAAELHDMLREHFSEDDSVEVIVERRAELRGGAPSSLQAPGSRSASARRRRARSVAIKAPALPPEARVHARWLVFVERPGWSGKLAEDDEAARLVIAFQRGAADAFDALYILYFDPVYAYLCSALDDHAEAEDVTQRAFVQALEALPRYRDEQPFRAWLFTIARNLVIDHRRKHDRTDVLEPAELGKLRQGLVEAGGVDRIGWISDGVLLAALDELSDYRRKVIELRYADDLDWGEVARRLDRNVGSVRKAHHDARELLRQRLSSGERLPAPTTDEFESAGWPYRVTR